MTMKSKIILIAVILLIAVGFGYFIVNSKRSASDTGRTRESVGTPKTIEPEEGTCSLDPTGLPDDCDKQNAEVKH